MKTILAIDLGKRNSVFCKLNTSSLKSETVQLPRIRHASRALTQDWQTRFFAHFLKNYCYISVFAASIIKEKHILSLKDPREIRIAGRQVLPRSHYAHKQDSISLHGSGDCVLCRSGPGPVRSGEILSR